jgi:ribosomal protein L10
MSKVSEQKAAVVENTVSLLKKYEVIAAADLNKVQSGMLMDLNADPRFVALLRDPKGSAPRRWQ